MKDPDRLLESDPALRRLLAANQNDRAPAAVRARVLSSLAASVTLTAGAAGSAAMLGSAGSAKLGGTLGTATVHGFAVKAAAGMVVAGFAAYGTVRFNDSSEGSLRPMPELPAPAAVTATAKAKAPEPAPELVPPSPADEAPEAVVPAKPRGKPAPTRPEASSVEPAKPVEPTEPAIPAEPVDPSSLAVELELIQRARAEARRGDTTAAKRTLDAYRSQFPNGKLRPEAEHLSAEVERLNVEVEH